MTRDGHSAGNQLEQAPPPPPPPLRSHAPHENLQAALDRGNLPTDRLALALICLVYGGIIARGELLPHEHRLLCGLVVAHAGLLALALAAPGRFLARRTALMAAVRFIDVGVLPLIVDWVRIHQPSRPARQAAEAAAAATAAAAAGSGWWAAARRWGVLAGARLQSAVLLVVGAAKLQSLVGAAVGAALPPALHLLLHTATIAAMCLNAPKACRSYVADPDNAALADAAFWALRQAVSTACPFTHEALHAADALLTPAQRCTVVTCVLEVSIGLVAATLLAWRTQLRVARKWAQQHAAHGAGAAAQQQLRASQYGRVAQPLMQAARACPGGMPVVCGLPAIYAFVAALVWQQRGGAAAAAGAG